MIWFYWPLPMEEVSDDIIEAARVLASVDNEPVRMAQIGFFVQPSDRSNFRELRLVDEVRHQDMLAGVRVLAAEDHHEGSSAQLSNNA